MTGETAAELRARLGALAEAATPRPWELAWQYRSCGICRTDGVVREEDDGTWADLTGNDIRLILGVVDAWPAIDGMLARLAAAEADAEKWKRRWDELASAGERHMWCEHGVLP